ncbi:MAG: hypothetical protein ACSLFD_05370 [Solirubrobacterales bacterium]
MFNSKKLAALLMFSAVVSIGAAGCGGGDDSEDPAPAPVETTTTTDTASAITQDELIEQGDDICAEVNAAVGTIGSSTTADASIQETQISDIYSGLAQSLGELGTPTDGEAPTEVIDAAEALADSGSTDGAAALADFQTAATDYGFTECGDAPVAPSSSSSDPSSSSGTDPSTVPADPGYVPPATAPAPAPAPAPAAPPTSGGGVAPAAPPSSGGSSGGSSSGGGISPG